MRVAIHQPECLPWLGFFDKMHRADKYVIFDHVQFKKRYFENRNCLKLNNDRTWVTVPVKSKSKFKQEIMNVEVSNETNWQRKMFAKIRHCASGTPHGKETLEELSDIIVDKRYSNLIDFNLSAIHWFRNKLGISTPIIHSSSMGVEEFTSSELISEICKKLNASIYLCGDSGKDYLKLEDFEKLGIQVEWQNFEHPVYRQFGNNFIPYLSSLDFVFNYGSNSEEYFKETILGGKIERN